jgi:hypothetical protein
MDCRPIRYSHRDPSTAHQSEDNNVRYALPLAIALTLVASIAHAHVTVSPAQSSAGMKVAYTLNVPTEGASATTSVELDIPLDVAILEVMAPAEEYRLLKAEGRIVGIVWQVVVPPGEGRKIVFVAQNPGAGAQIEWKVHQLFADGSRRDWVEAVGSKRPAPRTLLGPKP